MSSLFTHPHLPPASKRCNRCGEVKPAAAFCVDHEKTDGLSTICRRCRQLYRRKASPLAGQMTRFTTADIVGELTRRRDRLNDALAAQTLRSTSTPVRP